MFFTLTDKLTMSEDLYKMLEENLELYCIDKHFVRLFLEEDRELLNRAWYVYNGRKFSRTIKREVIETVQRYLQEQVECLKDKKYEIGDFLYLDARNQLFETFSELTLATPESTHSLMKYAKTK